MQPKSSLSDQGNLFHSRLAQDLNRRYLLYRLADSIDESFFGREFGSRYTNNVGRPVRLLVGLHYLKQAFNASNESVVDQFLENPY